jgi:hypothetical protein
MLFPTQADFRGRMVPALRVRIRPPKAGNGQAAVAPVKPKPPVIEDELLDDAPPAKPSLADDLDDEIDF